MQIIGVAGKLPPHDHLKKRSSVSKPLPSISTNGVREKLNSRIKSAPFSAYFVHSVSKMSLKL